VTTQSPTTRSPDRLRVGYLHLGKAESGVLRYGRMIAAGAARRRDIDVVEADAGGRDASATDLRRAARSLRDAEVLHLQWKLADWGGSVAALARLEIVLQVVRRPTVVTLHDLYPREGIRARWLDPGAAAVRRLSWRARFLVVHSREDASRLAGVVPGSRLEVVPHFVEERVLPVGREAARLRLGVDRHRVVTLLGHIVRRKGHQLVLEALPMLPPDVLVLFVGSPITGREARAEELRARAIELGVDGRVRFLGYVPEEHLELVLAATDVAVCPFRDLSASGALATWISAARPIVTSDLPAFRELNSLVPGALRIFAPYDAPTLAGALRSALDETGTEVEPAVDGLRRALAMPRIVERYLDVYRAAIGPRSVTVRR
jgi:glycosyltransferase involved in cell wall biosynthesis